MLFTGRENELAGTWTFPVMSAFPKTITAANVDEFARTYARKGGRKGAIGSYRPMLTEGDEFQSRAQNKLAIPAIAVGGFAGPFTGGTVKQMSRGPPSARSSSSSATMSLSRHPTGSGRPSPRSSQRRTDPPLTATHENPLRTMRSGF